MEDNPIVVWIGGAVATFVIFGLLEAIGRGYFE